MKSSAAIPGLLLIALVFPGACNVPGTRGVNEDAPVPGTMMAMRSKTPLATLDTGHGVYMRKCGECHTHMLPDEITSEHWHAVVPGMAWNAGLEPAEEKALLEYLIAAKSAPQ